MKVNALLGDAPVGAAHLAGAALQFANVSQGTTTANYYNASEVR